MTLHISSKTCNESVNPFAEKSVDWSVDLPDHGDGRKRDVPKHTSTAAYRPSLMPCETQKYAPAACPGSEIFR